MVFQSFPQTLVPWENWQLNALLKMIIFYKKMNLITFQENHFEQDIAGHWIKNN